MPPAKAELIGFVGECAVYHWLKRQYPRKDVDYARKSSMRKRLLPGEGDDSLGYDFEITYQGITWYLEVKTRVGDPMEIELGESQVMTATRCAGWKTQVFRVLYVSHAEDPTHLMIEQLPNPLLAEHTSRFRLVGRGFRYRPTRQ